MVIYTGYGIWLSGADTCRCMHFNAADMQCQWKVAQFSRCTVYIMYLCLCDRTSNCCPGISVYISGKVGHAVLIQVGGWGVIVCVTYVLVLMKVKLTIQERVMLQNYFNRDSMRGLVGILQYVVKGSLVVEGIGALGYACRFIPQFGLLRGIWYAVFHSISAFCNAGVDLLGDSSFAMYADDVLINTVTAFFNYSRRNWLYGMEGIGCFYKKGS